MPAEIVLSADDERIVKQNLQDLREYGSVLKKLAECGVDCSGLENLRGYMLDKFEKINEHFISPNADKRLL